MGQLRSVLNPHWAPGINDITTGTNESFKGWLCRRDYVVTSYNATNQSFEIYAADPVSLVSSIAHDVNRFSSASFETVSGIITNGELLNARAWPLIRAYYAAFFAAHSLSRIFGRSLSNLGRDETSALRLTARQSGLIDFSVAERLYVFSLSKDGHTVTAIPFDGGPHLDTWKQLRALLNDLQTQVLSANAATLASQDVSGFITHLVSVLSHETSHGNFLSKVRNGLNYRQDYGAWHPTGVGAHWAEVDRCLRAFLGDPLSGMNEPMTKPIARFAHGCAMVVGLNTEMVRELVERHPANKSFLNPRSTLLLDALLAARATA